MISKNYLPRYFKLIGFIIIAVAFITPILMGTMRPQLWEETELRREIAKTAIIIGFLLVVLSKEKIEDEFVASCRLRAFRIALIACIVYFLQDAFGTFGGNIFHSSFGLLIMQLIVYWFTFLLLKTGVLINGK
jgi:hypothetical protein